MNTCGQNDRLKGVAIFFTLEYSISSPVEDNKLSLSICETLYKCSKLTIQNCHGGNPIWRYVSNLICYITSVLLFHDQEFHWWTLQSQKPDAFQRKCHWSNRGQAFGRRQKVTACIFLTSTRFKRLFIFFIKKCKSEVYHCCLWGWKSVLFYCPVWFFFIHSF